MKWFSPISVSKYHNENRALQGTGIWFLTSPKLEEWKISPHSFLWLRGTCKLWIRVNWLHTDLAMQPDVERQYYDTKAAKTDASSCLQS